MYLKLFLKLGEKVQMWKTKLKIAIVNKDTDTIAILLDNTPEFSDLSQAEEVMYLLKEVANLAKKLKDETSTSMKQIKQNLNFLKSTQENKASSLDITL